MSAEDIPVTLLEGEEVQHNERPSIVAYFARNFVRGILTLGIFPLLYSLQSRFVVTDERVIVKTGILRTDTNEYRIEDVEEFSTGQSILERLLGQGNVSFSTGGHTSIVFYGLKDYESVANTIRNLQR